MTKPWSPRIRRPSTTSSCQNHHHLSEEQPLYDQPCLLPQPHLGSSGGGSCHSSVACLCAACPACSAVPRRSTRCRTCPVLHAPQASTRRTSFPRNQCSMSRNECLSKRDELWSEELKNRSQISRSKLRRKSRRRQSLRRHTWSGRRCLSNRLSDSLSEREGCSRRKSR